MKPEMCKFHPDVPYIVRPGISVHGGHIGWGCAVCNMLKLEEARRCIRRLEATLRKAETVMMIVEPRGHKAEYLEALAAIRAVLPVEEPT